jgi:hypothetical protein
LPSLDSQVVARQADDSLDIRFLLGIGRKMKNDDVSPAWIPKPVSQFVNDHEVPFIKSRLHADRFDPYPGRDKVDRHKEQQREQERLKDFKERSPPPTIISPGIAFPFREHFAVKIFQSVSPRAASLFLTQQHSLRFTAQGDV